MSTHLSAGMTADYAAVLLVDAVATEGEHTLGKRAEALTKVYAFGVGDNLDQERLGSPRWWGLLGEALEQGSDLHPGLSKRQRALVDAQITLANERATGTPGKVDRRTRIVPEAVTAASRPLV